MYSLIRLLTQVLALRVEWAKAKARADRWEEEVVLLDEEMRRSLEFCKWKASWWVDQLDHRAVTLPEGDPIREGLEAYAHQQAALEIQTKDAWELEWRAIRDRAQPIIQVVMGGMARDDVTGSATPTLCPTVEVDVEGEEYSSDFEDE